MKKVLQKTLFRRLHTLLLLAVMFVVGGSAWAEDKTVSFTLSSSGTYTEDVISASFDYTDGGAAGVYGPPEWTYGRLTVSSDGDNITKIVLHFASTDNVSELDCSVGTLNSEKNVWEGDAESVSFFNGMGTNRTIRVSSIDVTYKYEPLTENVDYRIVMNDAPDGAEVYVNGQTYTESATYSVMEKFKERDFSHNEVDGYWSEANYDADSHTYTVTYHHYYYYDVHITGGNGRGAINYSYREGSVIESRTEMLEDQFFVSEVNGWTAGDIAYVAAVPPTHGSVSVVYTENAPQVYTVEFVNAPEGATVTVNNDKTIGRDDDDKTYTTTLTLESYNFRASDVNGYDNEIELNGLNATVTYTEWPKYHVVVTGDLTDPNAGVTYNGTSYHNDEYIVNKWFYESNLKVISFPYYEGTINYDSGTKTITVNYSRVDYVNIMFNDIDSNYDSNKTIVYGDFTISGGYYDGTNYQLVNSRWSTYGMTITSSILPIEKIEFVEGYDNSMEAIRVNDAALNGNVWTCGSNSVNEVNVSSAYSYSGTWNYISAIRVWLTQLVNYTVNFVNAPDGATISVDGVSGTFEDGGHFEAAKGLTPEKVHGNCPGYDAEVAVEGNTVTVTFVKINYVEFVTSGISAGSYNSTQNGVTVTGYADYYQGVRYLNVWSTSSLVVESLVQPIERIVITRADAPTLQAVSNPAGLNGNEWTDGGAGNVKYVSFRPTSGADNYISKVRVYFPQPVEYTLVFAGDVPDEATVTIDGEQYAAGQFEGRKTLTAGDIDYTWPGYDADVTYNEETSTFTVTYHATTTYDVVVDPEGLEGAAVIYGEDEYAAGTGVITCRGTIDEEALSAKGVYGYVGEVSVSGTTITVTYTVSEYYDVAESDITVIEGDMAGLTKFKIAAPAGTTFSEILAADPQGKNVTVNGKAENSTIALGYENSFITFTNPVMANQYGTFTVEFAAGLFQTADGKKNNAFSYNFENVDPATIVNNYYVTLWGYQYPELAPDGANVTIGGHDGEITTADAYTLLGFHDQIPEFGTATTTLEGYDVEAVISGNQINVYFHKLATVSSYSPENTSNSLDDYESGYNELTVTFDAPFKESVNIANSDELPAGMSVTLPDGVTRGQIYANSGSSELHIGLNGGNVAGDYSVEIAKNLFSFSYAQAVDATITNDAFSQTWTLNAATTFRVNSYAIATEDVEGNEFTATQHNLNKFQAFAVSAPAEQVFSAVTNPVTVDVTVGDADPVQVAATAALEEEGAKAVFTLPAAYTEEGDVSVSVPAGVLTLGGLTSKAFEFDVTILPYEYFSISADPAPETTYTGDRNTIVITLPVGKTAATVGSTISLNGNSETVTAYAIDGNTVTLTLENGFQYGPNYYNIPKDFLTDTNGDKNNYFGSWSVNVVKQMMYASANVNGETTTTNSVTVEKFSSVEVYFDEESEYSYGVPAGVTLMKGEDPITITNGWNSAYNSVTYKYGSYYFIFDEISAPGTYTLHIPAGVFTSAEGNQNEEVNLDIVIPTPEYFAAMTVSPADGETMESLRTITLTAPDDVTFDDVKGLQGRVTVNDDPYNYPSNVEFADDKKSVTFNISEKTTDGDYTVVFPEGFVRSTDGEWSHELTATYTVRYPWFTLRSNNVTPATGEVAAIENITIAAPAGIEFATPAANVTIVVNGENTLVGASLVEGKMVLDYTATAANRYEISIPAETFTSTTGKKNKELTGITYTIQPSLAINEHSMDDKGDTWTTFCLNKDFTLEDGYTPYIVRDNGEGGIKLVELMGTPIVDTYNCYFNSAYGDATEHTDHSGTINSSNIAGKYQVTYESNQTYNDGGYYDITYGYKNLVFTIKVLDGAQAPSNAGALYYNPTLGTEVSTTFNQISDDTFTVTVESGHWASHVGGLYIEVATGTYNTPIVPANTGILVKGAAKSGIQYTQAGGIKADVSGNLLWGCTQSQTKEVGNDQYIYKLAWASSAYDNFGFYWGSNDGHSIQANAGKAYLILDADQSAGSNRMLIFGGDEGTLTAIDTVESVVADAPIFNLQGKRMPNTEHLPAGVYVKNGRKFIVK